MTTESQRTRCKAPKGHSQQMKQLPKDLSAKLLAPPRTLVRHVSKIPAAAAYDPLPSLPRTVHHWGQRKLLLTEIEFLSHCLRKIKEAGGNPRDYTVVYAGAADGRHIPFLWNSLFPGVFREIHLYDDVRRFAPGPIHLASEPRRTRVRIAPVIHSHPSLTDTFHKKYAVDAGTILPALPKGVPYNIGWFTEEVARSYHGRPVLFISDIRTNPDNDSIFSDNRAQMAWVDAMDPYACMLKHRMPFNRPEMAFLAGEILLQLWAPVNSTEGRLWAMRPYKRHTYKLSDYESRMFTFNKLYRPTCFKFKPICAKKATTVDGCRCYDCVGELYVLDRYLEIANKDIPRIHKESFQGWIADVGTLGVEISRRLGDPERLHQSSVFADHQIQFVDTYRKACVPKGLSLPRFSAPVPKTPTLPCGKRE